MRNKLVFYVSRLMTMEEAFRREKEEADRLLREQKLEYESKIVELQKQVMETSISQSMLSSILSSSGLVDSTHIRQQTLAEDPTESDHDEFSCQCPETFIGLINCRLSFFQIALGPNKNINSYVGHGRSGVTIR